VLRWRRGRGYGRFHGKRGFQPSVSDSVYRLSVEGRGLKA